MPFQIGTTVRYDYNGKTGQITGNRHGSRWEVQFGPTETFFIPESELVEFIPNPAPGYLFVQRCFSGIEDYRNTFCRLRLSGELTNLMYSMGNEKTRFFPHQFVPVLKFLTAGRGRLLIADEVGLGKTIEAMYIWQELRTRDNAHRLLVVVPAILKEKWIKDVSDYFDIHLQEVNAKGLHSALADNKHHLTLITSIESLRIDKSLSEHSTNEEESESDKSWEPIFDLVIIDEAHYMRNSGTHSFAVGESLRTMSKNLLLLSATPIQTGVSNLYNLLRLLAPGEYRSFGEFETLLEELKPLVRLANAVDRRDKPETIRELLVEALNTDAHSHDSDLLRLKHDFQALIASNNETKEHRVKRLRIVENLKSKFFYAPFVTRMRKRDVFEHRTKRTAVTIDFGLSSIEESFYNTVTSYLVAQDDGDNFNTFRLIARQRQMASCMPAALRTWRQEAIDASHEVANSEEDVFLDFEFNAKSFETDNQETISSHQRILMPSFDEFDLDELERTDTKFSRVLAHIQTILNNNPAEKIIIFSFFRGTVNYLKTRLLQNGIDTEFILGGLSPDEKRSRISRFAKGSANILVSSEVGSEGIDLQFSRIEINYDLPWNPMRVEQRIGRIDRIGQRYPEIYIYNAYCSKTIEGRVLSRLHGRIRLFEEVLGDVEEILGPTVERIELKTFRLGAKELSDEQIDEMLKQIDDVKANNERIAADLKENAITLSQYQQYVLDGIRASLQTKRLVTDFELHYFVKAFLNSQYPGSSVTKARQSGIYNIELSQQAINDLSAFLSANQIIERTNLIYGPGMKPCSFGSRPNKISDHIETIDINHALVRFMVSQIKSTDNIARCHSLSIAVSQFNSPSIVPGVYVYYVQQWIADGMVRSNELHYFVKKCGVEDMLSSDDAENLITTTMIKGKSSDYTPGIIDDELLNKTGQFLYDSAWSAEEAFERERKDLDADEKHGYLRYLTKDHEARASQIQNLLEVQRTNGTADKIVRLNEGRLNTLVKTFEQHKTEIESRNTKISAAEIAMGIIQVTEE